ncbi:MAG: GTP-binding protein, partial [Myxococcales bacterium]|nr:GTP-binding protein [Myxococcales bacterium]
FGAINIDAKLVVGVEGETVSLENGCVCCTMRDDLATETARLLSRPEPPEYILVEASGISDPKLIAHTFLSSELEAMVQVDSIIAMVDTEQLLELRHDDLHLALQQIDVADIVVLNKIDLVTRAQQEAVSARIRELVPDARLLPAVHAGVPVELIFGVEGGGLRPGQPAGDDDHHHHGNEHPTFRTWSWISDEPLSLSAFRDTITSLPPSVYRAKGILQLRDYPSYKVQFQMAGKRSSLGTTELWADDAPPRSELVFISSGDEDDFEHLQNHLDACAFEQHPDNQLVNWRDLPKRNTEPCRQTTT